MISKPICFESHTKVPRYEQRWGSGNFQQEHPGQTGSAREKTPSEMMKVVLPVPKGQRHNHKITLNTKRFGVGK